jgi:hypothetical protein
MATVQSITSTATPDGIHAAIKAARTPLPSHTLEGAPVRRSVAEICTAEVKHARNDFWTIVHRLNAASLFDRHRDPDCDVAFRLPHEAHAAAALNWLSHLGTHDSDRRGLWARWERWDREGRIAWLRRRRELLHGLLRQVGRYQEARRLIDQPMRRPRDEAPNLQGGNVCLSRHPESVSTTALDHREHPQGAEGRADDGAPMARGSFTRSRRGGRSDDQRGGRPMKRSTSKPASAAKRVKQRRPVEWGFENGRQIVTCATGVAAREMPAACLWHLRERIAEMSSVAQAFDASNGMPDEQRHVMLAMTASVARNLMVEVADDFQTVLALSPQLRDSIAIEDARIERTKGGAP